MTDTMTQLRHRLPRWAPFAAAIAAVVALQLALNGTTVWPSNWYAQLARPVDNLQTWIQDNRLTSVVFTGFFDPLSRNTERLIHDVASGLRWLPWYAFGLLTFAAIARTRRYVSASVCALAALYPAAVGLSDTTIETLALVIVSVLFSIAIGVPLGVWTSSSRRAERLLRPILDMMQVVPASVYLVPTVILFDVGVVPAAVATVIYAIPPMVRLTALGIEQVPTATVEAATTFGSSRLQTLRKVQLPLAMPSIVAGMNQTIMMALGIVVIAGLVGAGGLAQEVNETLRLRSPGRGFVVGFAIVAIAIVLDRVSRAFTEPRRNQRVRDWKTKLTVPVLLVMAIAVGKFVHWNRIPAHWNTDIAAPFDNSVIWVRDHFGTQLKMFSDFIVRDILLQSRHLLTKTLAWPVVIMISVAISWIAKGWRLALFTLIGLVATGLTGLWPQSIDTLIQVSISVVITTAIAIPLGVVVGRVPWINKVMSPILDALQTIPSLIYAVPIVMIFALSPVPGVIASVLYALPPGIRLTALGIQQVPETTVEAATTFGASPRQVMWGVRIPLAMPSIILAINQMIMMVLAMVIISGLIGGGALGFEAVEGLTRSDKVGLGVEVGVAIVAMAMILDRLTQALANRFASDGTTDH